MSLQDRLRRLESQTGDINPAEDLGPWSAWWTPTINGFPPPFPADMPARVRQLVAVLVLMNVITAVWPLAAIPPHIKELLPADVVGHLRQQHPSDEELSAKSDLEWASAANAFSAPHYADLSARRQALKNQRGGFGDSEKSD